MKQEKLADIYLAILKEELMPAMGCTEPIAIAYCAAKAREVLGTLPDQVQIGVSGNIVKNVKSVIVPNTDGLKGIAASAAAGIVGGRPEKVLEVIAEVTSEQKQQMREFLAQVPIKIQPLDTEEQLDILVTLHAEKEQASVRISGFHTNIVQVIKNGETLYESGVVAATEVKLTDRSLLKVEDIYAFAEQVEISKVQELLDRQIECNWAIAEEGLRHPYGANIGKVLLKTEGNTLKTKARAYAAAGSDARMNGCEMPVIINSGSGNQGMTASVPVIVYARELGLPKEKLYRALVLSNLITIHQKTGIGRLSAYCGAVSAGCGAGCGIAYLQGGDLKVISHTLVNALAIVSGIVCDGAKASCAGKIAAAVDAGIFGYQMYCEGQEFEGGDGIVSKGVENTIHNVGRLGKIGMKETDKEIIRIMTEC
ncbi:L-serine ammonia-lyase, iron-sulfur-dependent, subunit alpha [Candidatus Merdisoma sp. JLR.KK006]|uniref:L-cysteine desulfidase family protein n=1 Tax=Candidatus Merdisoma sp. JLR.KK006 TaxID=3112626 RepID=UPI002FEFFB00